MAEHQLPKLNTGVRFPSSARVSTGASRRNRFACRVGGSAGGLRSSDVAALADVNAAASANPTKLRACASVTGHQSVSRAEPMETGRGGQQAAPPHLTRWRPRPPVGFGGIPWARATQSSRRRGCARTPGLLDAPRLAVSGEHCAGSSKHRAPATCHLATRCAPRPLVHSQSLKQRGAAQSRSLLRGRRSRINRIQRGVVAEGARRRSSRAR
jgi:hypothetical protein